MKPKKYVFYLLMLLPLASVLTALLFLPGQIPAHYGTNGQVTRWDSKYELLLLPAATILMGCFFLKIAQYSAKHEENGNNNEKFCIAAGSAALMIFNVMTGVSLYTSLSRAESVSFQPFDLSQLLFGLLGIAMIFLGNSLPKLRRNPLTGLKTRWSLKDETAWKKSQRFGGITYMVGGAVIVVLCCFVKGITCLFAATGVITVLLAVDLSYTYKIAKG